MARFALLVALVATSTAMLVGLAGGKVTRTTTSSRPPVHGGETTITTATTTSTAASDVGEGRRVRVGEDVPYGASDMLSDKLVALMEHDGDYYMHNQGQERRELARCELLIVNADLRVGSGKEAAGGGGGGGGGAAADVFERMAVLTDHSIPVSNLQEAVCMRFVVEGSGTNSATGRNIFVAPGEDRLRAILLWASDFASFEHMLLIDEADSFFWLDRIFLDLHSPIVGLAHTHPWLYWGSFEHDKVTGSIIGPDPSGVILSANIVEELAVLLRERELAMVAGYRRKKFRPQEAAAAGGGGGEVGVVPGSELEEASGGVLRQLHNIIVSNIHDGRLKPAHDRRFGVPKERCQSSSLSVTGLSQEDLEVMVQAVQAGASMYSGRHPCLALSTISEEVIEELEVGGFVSVGLLVGVVLWFRRRRRRLAKTAMLPLRRAVASPASGKSH